MRINHCRYMASDILVNIGTGNGLSPARHVAITCSNAYCQMNLTKLIAAINMQTFLFTAILSRLDVLNNWSLWIKSGADLLNIHASIYRFDGSDNIIIIMSWSTKSCSGWYTSQSNSLRGTSDNTLTYRRSHYHIFVPVGRIKTYIHLLAW